MAAASREEVIARYRRLREISKAHHSNILRFVSRDAILKQARRLGLAFGNTVVADDVNHLDLAFDLLLYTAPAGRSRAIDRYARAARLAPGTDEAIVLAAMGRATFSVWKFERLHETVGLVLRDVLRKEEAWLVDENLERSAKVGMCFASRLVKPDMFAMTCGVFVPVDGELLVEAFEDLPLRLQSAPADVTAEDRRFATAIYRIALETGIMDYVGFRDAGEAAA